MISSVISYFSPMTKVYSMYVLCLFNNEEEKVSYARCVFSAYYRLGGVYFRRITGVYFLNVLEACFSFVRLFLRMGLRAESHSIFSSGFFYHKKYLITTNESQELMTRNAT